MHELHLLADFVLILVVALGVAWLFSRLKLPTIVGFLAAGVILGPGVTGIVADPDEIALLAEIGVILLLFSIGVELSFEELKHLRKLVFGAGGLQLIGTGLVAGGLSAAFGFGMSKSIFFGALVALSSTAIVLTELRHADELGTAHGRNMLSILIFQDLAVVPLILVVPFLGGEAVTASEVLVTIGKAAGVIVGVWVVASYVFPWVSDRIARTQRRELFTMFTVVVAVGTAYVSGAAGVSLALGAFLAGLVVSESPYSEQMIAELEPFKDVFNSLFFVAMGLLFVPRVFVERPVMVLGLIGGIFFLKAVILAAVVMVMGQGLRVALIAGLGLAQVGEFSFILAREGTQFGLLSDPQYGLFIAAAVSTMALTPFLLRAAPRVVDLVSRIVPAGFFEAPRELEEQVPEERLRNHVIVVGFGTNGRNVAHALRNLQAPYVVVELNPQTVRDSVDEPIRYGDATREHILKGVGVEKAKALIVTVSDRMVARHAVGIARRLNPQLTIIARTRFASDVEELYRQGASQVIADEFETSVELLGQTLQAYDVRPGRILREKDDLRRENYGMMRFARPPDEPQARHTLKFLSSTLNTDLVRVPRKSAAAGKTIGDLHLRSETGTTVLAVIRGEELLDHPGPELTLEEWDQALLIGRPDQIDAARSLLSGETPT